MNLWAVARPLVRRWLLSVPLLLLTAVAAVWTAYNVQPDYVGTTYVTLLPPAVQRSAPAGQTLAVNPWDPERLTGAVIVRLNAKSMTDQIDAEGFVGSWEAGLDPTYGSVVGLEVTSPTKAQVLSMTTRLLREVDDEVARQQAPYLALAPDEKITTTRLGSGDDLELAGWKIRRNAVAVSVAGLLLTLAVTATVDRLIARRAPRRRPDTGGVAGRSPDVVTSHSVRQVPFRLGVPYTRSTDTEATQPVVHVINAPLQVSTTAATPNGHAAPNPDEATIVLPLSNAPWAERQRNGHRRPQHD
jgi:hypothetical protein